MGRSLHPVERGGSEEANKEPGLLTEVGRKVVKSSPDKISAHSTPPSLSNTCRQEKDRDRGHFTLTLQREICVAFLAHFERCFPSGMLSE